MLAQLDHAHARAAAVHRTSREASPAKHAPPSKLPPRQVHAAVAVVRVGVRMLNSWVLGSKPLCWAMLCFRAQHGLMCTACALAAGCSCTRKQTAGSIVEPHGQDFSAIPVLARICLQPRQQWSRPSTRHMCRTSAQRAPAGTERHSGSGVDAMLTQDKVIQADSGEDTQVYRHNR